MRICVMTIKSFTNIRRKWFQDENGHGTLTTYDAAPADDLNLPSVCVTSRSYDIRKFDTPQGQRTFRVGETYLHTANIHGENNTRVVQIASIREGSLALLYKACMENGVESRQYMYYPQSDLALAYCPT